MALLRQIAEEYEPLVKSGVAKVYGGVIRDSKGRILKHLEVLNNSQNESYKDILNELGKINLNLKNSNNVLTILEKSAKLTNILSSLNLLTSGLNLCVSVAGFAMISNKLNNISAKIDDINKSISELKDNEIQKLYQEFTKSINFVETYADRCKKFKNEQLNGEEYQQVMENIKNMRDFIINLIGRLHNCSISLTSDTILKLYDSYLLANKIMIYRLYESGRLDDYSEMVHILNLRDDIKSRILKNEIYKSMITCEDVFFSEGEIQEVIQYHYKLFNYNVEFVESQKQFLLEA